MNYSKNQVLQFYRFINSIHGVKNQIESDILNEGIPYNKKGNKIHIKKKNVGKFTEYCNGKVTQECIQRGKNSSDPKIRKRATFANNARKWHPAKKT